MKNKFIYSLLFILTVYSSIITYAILSEFDIKAYVLSFTDLKNSDYLINAEAEYKFVRNVIENYFEIEAEINQEDKFNSIASITSSDTDPSFLSEFKHAVDLYAKQNGVRSYDLKKIFRDKRKKLSYLIFLNMKSDFPEEKENFLMRVKLELTPDNLNKSYKIKSWAEKVLPLASKLLTSKEVFVDQSGFTELRLPCDFEYVGPVKEHKNIALNLESRDRLIKFKPKDSLIEHAKYKANCKKKVFNLDLVENADFHTVYHAFNYSDGVSKVRKLTEREKRIKLLEKHMGVKVIR